MPILREVIETDLPVFFEQQIDREACRLAAFEPRERETFFRHWATILADPAVMARTIVRDGEVVGNVVSFPSAGHREVGYWVGKSYWRQGLASAALSEFLELETTRPLRALVAEHNAGSTRVLLKCGFRRIGVEQNFSVYDGAPVAGVVFELV